MTPRCRRGFALLDLMLVVAILGVLASLAVPMFVGFEARAKRQEALLALNGIWRAQQVFYSNNARFSGTFDELGVVIEGGQRLSATSVTGKIYTYALSQPNGALSWYCSATGNPDNDPWLDVLVVEEDNGG